jgi:membrane-associated protein
MSLFLDPLLTFIQAYGYPVLGLTTLVAAIGAPLPMTLVLLAAGAFAAQGDFNMALLAAVVITASVAGDCTGYVIGRRWGSKLLEWLPRSRVGRRFITLQAIERSRLLFRRHGGWAIVLTRTLLSALGSVTNLVAGAETYPIGTFVFFDIPSEALGAILCLGLGCAVGASWEAAGDILGGVSLFVAGLLCVMALAYHLLHDLKRDRKLR